jgi:hypothetical protein
MKHIERAFSDTFQKWPISQATRTAGGRAADSDSRHTSLLHLCMISLTSEISYARHDTTHKCVGGRGTL